MRKGYGRRQSAMSKAVCFQMSSVRLSGWLRHWPIEAFHHHPSLFHLDVHDALLTSQLNFRVILELKNWLQLLVFLLEVEPKQEECLIILKPSRSKAFLDPRLMINPSLMRLPLGRITLTWGILAVGGRLREQPLTRSIKSPPWQGAHIKCHINLGQPRIVRDIKSTFQKQSWHVLMSGQFRDLRGTIISLPFFFSKIILIFILNYTTSWFNLAPVCENLTNKSHPFMDCFILPKLNCERNGYLPNGGMVRPTGLSLSEPATRILCQTASDKANMAQLGIFGSLCQLRLSEGHQI